ncbi:MAG: hypothetical protein JWM84_4029 [Nocardioides sp.]|nr:hypothetical protein [Nocardioides sp.]
MFVRMNRTHDYLDRDGFKRRIPAGWQGDLDEAVASKAIEAGVADAIERAAAASTGSIDAQAPTAGTVKPGGAPVITHALGRPAPTDGPKPALAPVTDDPHAVHVPADFAKFDHDGDGRPGGRVKTKKD